MPLNSMFLFYATMPRTRRFCGSFFGPAFSLSSHPKFPPPWISNCVLFIAPPATESQAAEWLIGSSSSNSGDERSTATQQLDTTHKVAQVCVKK